MNKWMNERTDAFQLSGSLHSSSFTAVHLHFIYIYFLDFMDVGQHGPARVH